MGRYFSLDTVGRASVPDTRFYWVLTAERIIVKWDKKLGMEVEDLDHPQPVQVSYHGSREAAENNFRFLTRSRATKGSFLMGTLYHQTQPTAKIAL